MIRDIGAQLSNGNQFGMKEKVRRDDCFRHLIPAAQVDDRAQSSRSG
jgi:hypothetical protein